MNLLSNTLIEYYLRNKNILIKIILIVLLIVMLISYDITRISSLNGLKIWLINIVPALFPYILITNIIMHFDAFTILTKVLYPILHPVLKLSRNACFCFVTGFMCGFPIGIKTINDMLIKNKISISEANYLAVFCNNISPAFYLNFIIHQNLNINNRITSISNGKFILFICMLVPYMSSILCSILYRFEKKYKLVDINNLCNLNRIKDKKENTSNFIDECILNTFNSLFKICGYIIIFSIISGIINTYINIANPIKGILNSFLEISTSSTAFLDKKTYIHIMYLIPLASFGGLSALFQSLQMITSPHISKSNYIKYRVINWSISYILCSVIINII